MENKLYVGNISFQLDEQQLEDAFGAYGTVKSVRIITDRETGRSKGFGFVEMETGEEAQECISNLDGKDLSGRNIRVNIAREKTDRNDPRRRRRW
ncbi:MAG: RNA-binding protein [Bacteriovoracales bacterium]|nr:RNA-binding protein [Bacteriovoracales bacterium]